MNHPHDSDRESLHRFGYAQQLLRDMGGFSNFAISFSIISILTGGITLYKTGLTAGGPLIMGLGWPLVTLFVLLIAASLAELASAVPTSGALYHWSSLLGGPGWGWFTAWFNLLGLVGAIAGIDYGCAQFLAPLLHMPNDWHSHLPLFGAILLSHGIFNHIGIRVIARLNDISAVYHMLGVGAIIVALGFFAPKQPISFLFNQGYTTITDKPFWFAFMTGLLQAQWTYTGYDASAHTIEETKDARVRAPWGVYLSVAVSGIFGYLMLMFITLAIPKLDKAAAADNTILYIFSTALGDRAGSIFVAMMVGAMWFCGLACVTSTSRMIFAFARDGGLPISKSLSSVSTRWRVPVTAIWVAVVMTFLLPCIVLLLVKLQPKLSFDTIYPAMTGISTICLYLSYGFPILLKLIAKRRGLWGEKENGPWCLGKMSTPINVISVLWIAFITVLFVLPPNDLTGKFMLGTFLVLLIYFFVAIQGRFKGPLPQARSEEELQSIESQFSAVS